MIEFKLSQRLNTTTSTLDGGEWLASRSGRFILITQCTFYGTRGTLVST